LKWLWIIPALLLVLGGTLVGVLLATEPGTRWLLHRVSALAPGEFIVQEVNGILLGPLALRRASLPQH
jgi:autotransporter translocation and assembly factor TamB